MKAALFALAVCYAGCAAPTEPFTLDFPSRDAFVRSVSAEVMLIPLAPTDLDACTRLVVDGELGGLADAETTGSAPVCAFRGGEVTYPSAPEGAVAYVALARDDGGRVLFSGCTVRNVYVDSAPLEIVLTPTEHYREEFRGAPAETCRVEEKCGAGCP